jgi:hypothetical protein
MMRYWFDGVDEGSSAKTSAQKIGFAAAKQ